MDAEYLLVEFIIVHSLPSPGLTGGSDATVGCFKDDINIQADACVTVVLVVVFCSHYTCSALFAAHMYYRPIHDVEQSGTLEDKIVL